MNGGMPRVLQLGPYPPPHGGVQANLSAIRAALAARRSASPVIALTRSSDTSSDDTEVYRPTSALELVRTVQQLRSDVVHLHIGGRLTPRLLGLTLLCSLLPGRKSVLTFHSGGYPTSPQGRSARPASLRGAVFRRLDRIIGVNEEIVAMFRRFGVEPDRLRLISPHVFAPPSPDTVVPEPLRGFLRAHRPVLIAVGLLEQEYNLEAQIDVLGVVREELGGAGLVLIGSGSLEAGLRRHIAGKAYAAHVLLCGDVAHDVTLSVIDRSDVMLRTTVYDGDSVSVREALAMGLPVVATDCARRPEGVELLEAGDLNELHAAIRRCLRRGRSRSPQRDDGQTNIEAVLDLYRELI